jgi:hypothetical protein
MSKKKKRREVIVRNSEYRWGIKVIKERGDRRFDNGTLG